MTRLRNAAREVPADDVAGRAQAERALTTAIGKLVALAENYPALKASANFLELQQELSNLEDELQMARRYYNGTVRNQNVLVQSFPGNLVAGAFGSGRAIISSCRTQPSAMCRRSRCPDGLADGRRS